jgi:ribosome modulation factor
MKTTLRGLVTFVPEPDGVTREYAQGYQAWQLRIPADECPYHLATRERGQWFSGWYDRRAEEFIEKIDQRYPMVKV